MAICATARYISKGVCAGGLTSIGKVNKSFFICWNMLSQVASNSKVFAPLSNLKSGFAFSASFGRNLDNAANLPFSCCTSFTQVKLRIPRMASHLSGLASIPLCVIIKPRNLPPPTLKTHFSELSLRSCFLTLARTDLDLSDGVRPFGTWPPCRQLILPWSSQASRWRFYPSGVDRWHPRFLAQMALPDNRN